MTLQQLEYALAVDEYHHFMKAAAHCGVTQSTLSLMIKKLEEELDVNLFDRSCSPVKTTTAGQEILRQARIVMKEAKQLREISLSEKQRISGNIHLGVSPTIAPYIMPHLFVYINSIPDIKLYASEMHRDKLVKRLLNGQIDMAIMSPPKHTDSLLEIPLYREQMLSYVSPNDPLWDMEALPTREIPKHRLWALVHEVSLILQVDELKEQESLRTSRYESGSLTTLIHIINANDGGTLIPELHIPLLTEDQKLNVRPLVDPVPYRQVSLFVRQDYVHEGLLNVIADGIKQVVPERMIDEHLAKYPIKL